MDFGDGTELVSIYHPPALPLLIAISATLDRSSVLVDDVLLLPRDGAAVHLFPASAASRSHKSHTLHMCIRMPPACANTACFL
jgi:hypothetical protein